MKHYQTKLVLDGIRKGVISLADLSTKKSHRKSKKQFDFGALFGMPGSKLKKSVVSGFSTLVVITAMILVTFLAVPAPVLASTIAQTNWSGGVGTSLEDNQYLWSQNVTPTSSQVSVGSSQQAAWCNTAHCNSSWPLRKAFYTYNQADGSTRVFSDYTKRLTLPYEVGMKTDFSDLRFTDASGVELDYYLNRVEDGVQAEVWVHLPSLGHHFSSYFVYFGNNSAVSQSTNSFFDHDDLENDSLAGFNDYQFCSSADVANSAITISAYCGITWGGFRDHTEGRVTEYDYKPDLSGVNCGSLGGNGASSAANYLITSVDGEEHSSVSFQWLDNDQCGIDTEYFIAAMDGPPGTNGHYPNQASEYHFKSSQYYRFRQVNHYNGGVDFYYSDDGGATYHEVASYSPNNIPGQGSFFHLQADQFPASLRDVRSYNNEPRSGEAEYTHFGVIEYLNGRLGLLTSGIIDLNGRLYSSYVTFSTAGDGVAGIRVLSSNSSSDLQNAAAGPLINCEVLQSGDPISDSNCVTQGDRYYVYQLLISETTSHNFAVTGVNLEYLVDNDAPGSVSNIVMRKDSGGPIVAEGGWFNSGAQSIGNGFPTGPYPNISWGSASDNAGGSGVLGYCLYVGTDQNANLSQTAGLITAQSAVNTNGECNYATSATAVDLESLTSHGDFAENVTYYFKVQTIDAAGNLSASTSQSTFKVDKTYPQIGSSPFAPNGIINTKDFSVQFGSSPGAVVDNGGSGAAGWKYCIAELDVNTGNSDCALPSTHEWYGDGHTGAGFIDLNGITPFTESLLQGFTTTPADYPRILSDGYNSIIFAIIDNAGNFNAFNSVVVRTSTVPASSPQALQASPTSAQENNFAFTWSPPQTYQGPVGDIDYCYTINEPIASDIHNCVWTGKNITQLAAGPYATRQGVNTLYIMARDQTRNYSVANAVSVNFSATTIAPGAPSSLDVSDVSVRATSTWKLAMSWAPPTQPGSGIASYKILRSTDGVTYSEVGTTSDSNLSFIDAGLSQVTYSYQVKACDNAGNCGVASNTFSRKPTGRFSAPANLVLGSGQPVVADITTRKATIQWQTDRDSDSKIAIGTKPGEYAPDETGNSNQVASHSVNLTNLQPGTQYYYVAKWTDGDGNTGVSPEGTFTTAPAPSVGEVSAQNVGISSAMISFKTLNTASVKLNYGKSSDFGGVEKLNTSFESSDYSIPLTSLDDGTKYYYRFTLVDREGNEYEGNINSFTTTARPRISNIKREDIEGEPSSTQRFTWDTNTATSSGLIYSAQGEQQLEAIDSKLTLTHSLTLTGLKDTTTYGYVIRSRDSAGNTVTSERAEFTTALDTRPPKITDVVVETAIRGSGTEARGQITVAWKTDEPSTSQVAFGQGQSGDYTGRTYEDGTMTTEHVVVISDLPTSSVYHVQAISHDVAQNEAQSENQSVVLGRASDNIFSVIFEALSKIFGLPAGKQE
jgi:hypothetical protein